MLPSFWTVRATTRAPAVSARRASSSRELWLLKGAGLPFTSTATRYARSMGSAVG